MAITSLYRRWDGTQTLHGLDAERALDELSRYLMEGFDLQQALDWMRESGFELAGMQFRVMGLEELLAELRKQAREQMARYDIDGAFDELRRLLEDILAREQQALRQEHGLESERWNDFKRREQPLERRLSEVIEGFRDYVWTDEEAGADYRDLLERLDELRALESFHARNRRVLQGPDKLGFDEAVELMRRVEALAQLARDLLEGNLDEVSAEELRDLLGDAAARSILVLRDLEGSLERAGYLRQGAEGPALTPRAIRRLGELALEDIYASLRGGQLGSHETSHRGVGALCTERTRPYVFGGPAQLDPIATLRNALRHSPPRSGGLRLEPDDLEVYDTDLRTETTTVMLLDMSWSMSSAGRWAAAKRVAIAMDHLIRTHYPRDRFFTVGFYTKARELNVRELPELVWNMEDPFTNLQDGLRVAQRLIERHPSPNKQIIVITDGQPTAYYERDELRVEWPNGRRGVSPHAVAQTLAEVRRVTRQEITINTFMLDDAPELLGFVEAMTRINRGRAFYTTPGSLGNYVMVDYLARKRRRIA
jgi:uncharacterized protein with von Willebrand factor type A (vWA) domain